MAGKEVNVLSQEFIAPVNTVFQRKVLEDAKSVCPYFLGCTEAIISEHSGSFTATWRRYNNITPTTTALTEIGASNADVSLPTRNSTRGTSRNFAATLKKYGQYMILSEEVDLGNYTSQSAALAKVLGISAGRSLNMLQRNEMEDNATAYFSRGESGVGYVNTAIQRNDIRAVVNFLTRNNAMPFTSMTEGSGNYSTTPLPNSFIGICHPDVEEDIRTLTGFAPVQNYASQTETYVGEIGAVSRVRFIVSSDATVDTNTGAAVGSTGCRNTGAKIDTYPTVIYGEEAFGCVGLGTGHIKEIYRAGDQLPGIQVIAHPRGSSGVADPLNEISTIGWKSWHAATTLCPLDANNVTTWARVIYSGAKNITGADT